MKVLIIEDEPLAAEKLSQMLKQYDSAISVLAQCSSIESAVKWLHSNPAPDLGFFDIQLGDGVSFEIFEKATINFPVIFTTAYDQFAIKAFKVNSVDYLLKPIEEAELTWALKKYKELYSSASDTKNIQSVIASVAQLMEPEKKYRDRFVISVGQHLKVIPVSEIVCFYSEEKSTFIMNSEGRSLHLDQSLNQIEDTIDPKLFFRTSRKDIINLNHIHDIISYGKNRLKISTTTTGKTTMTIVVSREKVKSFKEWLENSGS